MQPPVQPLDSFRCTLHAVARANSNVLAMPFDLARENYARAVRAGLIERSLLQSARFTRAVSLLERMALGPWARAN